ncbi:YciK family oxidoreductase [Paraferrimonas sp. SM1919]|uniref:YciK family oxidoreductase n=1 Tax=Paraferrimonas sp. SM1919 TaxID=2662263 RepID=UPI0013D11E83|nr:YciK family oxidoreductase [Paraferrimonas sp. SM1919]
MTQAIANAYQAATDALAGKVILITGAGDGIGKSLALASAKAGAQVILLGKTTKKLEAVYDQIMANGSPEPAIVPMDLNGATEEHYQGLSETIEAQYGKLDAVVNNAGRLGVLGPFAHTEKKSFDEVMKVHVSAPLFLTKALLPVLQKADNASVIFTSSGVGKKGRAFWGPYAIAKFATEGMMQTIADEFEGSSIRVNAINPGATKTRMRAQAFPAEDTSLLKTADEVLAPYLYLLSDDSIGCNGKSIDAQPK